MFSSNLELLKHILDEVIFMLDSTIDKNKDDVINNPILSRALIRSLEIMGEASNKMDTEFTALYPPHRVEKNGWHKKSPHS